MYCENLTVSRRSGIQDSNHITSGRISSAKHSPSKALGDRKRSPVVGDHQRKKWKQKYQNGLLHLFTVGLTRRSSISTDVSPVDVDRPPPAILPSAHPPAKSFETNQEESTLYSPFLRKTRIAKSAKCTKVTRAPCRINHDDRADRKKIAEKFTDMITAYHKVINEDQERVETASQICSAHARLGDAM